MRVDKWLWTARLFKTRALASDAAKGGRVHVDGVAVKPSRDVRPGDELQITLGAVRRTVIVRGAAERRVSAAEAAAVRGDGAEHRGTRAPGRAAPAGRVGDRGGRPTKRDRRRYESGRR